MVSVCEVGLASLLERGRALDEVGRTQGYALPQPAVAALLAALEADRGSPRATAWFERDLALILTGLLAALRADELRRADVLFDGNFVTVTYWP